jgi:hypothetical protein
MHDKQVATSPPPPYNAPVSDYTALFLNTIQEGADQVTRNTLDEPLSDTIMRDVNGITAKLQTVLSAGQANTDQEMTLKEWDLWGPLIFSLLLAVYPLTYIVYSCIFC